MVVCVGLLLASPSARSLPDLWITLDAIDHVLLPGNGVEIRLQFSESIFEPSHFVIFDPARIAVDLPGVLVSLPQRNVQIRVGMAVSVTAVQAGDTTRVVVNLVKVVPYRIQVDNRMIRLIIEGRGSGGGLGGTTDEQRAPVIGNIDFVDAGAAEGRVVVELPQPAPGLRITKRGDHVVVEIPGAILPKRLERLLDVGDFATPIRTIDAFSTNHSVHIVIVASGPFEQTAYQTDRLLTIAMKPAP